MVDFSINYLHTKTHSARILHARQAVCAAVFRGGASRSYDREDGGNGESEAKTEGVTGKGEAMTDTGCADGAVAGADEVLIGANK